MAKPTVGGSQHSGRGATLGVHSCDQLDLGTAGISIFSGTGAPGNLMATGQAPDVGDLYFRKDGGANSYLYRCTASGPPATWAALVV